MRSERAPRRGRANGTRRDSTDTDGGGDRDQNPKNIRDVALMASVWIRTRPTKDGSPRFRVEYRPGGREERARFAGSFTTKRLARILGRE